jgi:hypothetical protein
MIADEDSFPSMGITSLLLSYTMLRELSSCD